MNLPKAKIIVMGCEVSDQVTGFTGVVTAIATHLTGCSQILIQPRQNKEGDKSSKPESQWVDITRCLRTGAGLVGNNDMPGLNIGLVAPGQEAGEEAKPGGAAPPPARNNPTY